MRSGIQALDGIEAGARLVIRFDATGVEIHENSARYLAGQQSSADVVDRCINQVNHEPAQSHLSLGMTLSAKSRNEVVSCSYEMPAGSTAMQTLVTPSIS